ncbi:hypothetical protein quinque_009573 [Culex quinquefasciatus]
MQATRRPAPKLNVADRKAFLTHIRNALTCANIVSYAQGFMLLRKAANEYKWNLHFDGIALMWHGGCTIRSVFLGNIRNAFVRNPAMSHLLLDNFFKNDIVENQQSWREVVSRASQCLLRWLSLGATVRGTTLGRTRTSCLPKRSSLCTPTGPARASTFPLVLCDEHDAAG